MSIVQRRTVVAAAVSALFLSPFAPVRAQPGGQPDPNARRLLVATFRVDGVEPRAGVDAAEALRNRMQRSASPRELFVVPREEMNARLGLSGFPADAALALMEVGLLAKDLRADEIVDGVITKTPTGVSLSARLVLPTNLNLVQPLPTVEARTPEDAAKALERHLAEARIAVGDFQRCARALAAQDYAAARAAAQAAIARYPASTLGRLCLMDAYSRQQQPVDSVISAALGVLRIDSTSILALTNLADAYREKGDTARAVVVLKQLVVYQPDLRPQLLKVLGQLNQPRVAIPIVRDMLHDAPGDPELLHLLWLFQLSDQQWKDALATGDALVRVDTAAATPDFFARSISAALADSQPARALELANAGLAKFPRDATLWAMLAQTLRRGGRTAEAITAMRRALSIDPATENGWAFLVVTQLEAGQLDSALASARQAVAAHADAAKIGGILEVSLGQAAKRAGDVKTRGAWLDAVRLSAAVDSIASTANTQFFLGFAAFNVGLDALQQVNTSRKCDDALLAESMWATASVAMPKAARAGAEQAAYAAQVMTTIGKYDSAIADAKRRFCKGR